MSAPAAALRSMSSCTFATRGARHDDAADDAGRRDDRHVGAARPSRVPLSIVTVRKSGVAPAPMISAADGLQRRAGRAARAAARGRACDRPARAAPAAATCAVGELPLQRLVLALDVPQADVAAPDAPRRRETPPDMRALHFGEHAEGRPPRAPARRCASSPARRSGGCARASRRGTGSRRVDGYRAAPWLITTTFPHSSC